MWLAEALMWIGCVGLALSIATAWWRFVGRFTRKP